MQAKYPRVLLVSKNRISERDNTGIALGRWFQDWPRESLLHVFSGVAVGDTRPLEPHEYRLGRPERRNGWLLLAFRDRARRQTTRTHADARASTPARFGMASRLVHWVQRWAVRCGLVDVLFRPRASDALDARLDAFRPQILFILPSDAGLLALGNGLAGARQLPVCLQVLDDYPSTLYKTAPAVLGMHRRFAEGIVGLMRRAGACFVPSHAMAECFAKRYGREITPLLYCAEQSRFRFPAYPPSARPRPARIVYCGGLTLRRWEGVRDVCEAAALLNARGWDFTVHVHCSGVTPEATQALTGLPVLCFHDLPADAEVPRTLSEADVLLLPESFDPATAEYTRFSLSSKVHLYMQAKRPVLVYGPAGISTVEYARKWRWAAVVDRAGDAGSLAAVIERLVSDGAALEEQLRAGEICLRENHDEHATRERLRSGIVRALEPGNGT